MPTQRAKTFKRRTYALANSIKSPTCNLGTYFQKFFYEKSLTVTYLLDFQPLTNIRIKTLPSYSYFSKVSYDRKRNE